MATLHLLKLCVGADGVEDLIEWQAQRAAEARARGEDSRLAHVTRMRPKRADELLAGGSIYWVFKGMVLARQRVLELQTRRGTDGIERCVLRLDSEVVRTLPQPRRPFQGWRYLTAQDAPADLIGRGVSELPPQLAAGLARVGVL